MSAARSPISSIATWRPAQLAIHKISTTPGRSVARHHSRHRRDLRATTASPPATIDYRPARHDDGDQRRARAQGRARRHADQRRLPRHHSHRAPSARRALLDHAGAALAEPAAGEAPSPQGRQRPARSAARRRARAARRSRRARGRPRLEGRGGRGGRGLLPVLLSQPGARGTRQGHPRTRTARACSSPRRHRSRRSSASSSASPRPACAPSSDRRCAATSAGSTVRCARPGCIADLRIMASNGGVATPAMVSGKAGDDAAVGARRRRPRRRLGRRLERAAQARHLRHRRHQRRHRHRRRRPLCRDRCAQRPRSPASRCCCR